METLRSLGYLKKKGDGYSNSAMTSKWLVNSSGMDLLISKPNRYSLFRVVSGQFPIETHYALGGHANGKLVIGKREPQSQDHWIWSNRRFRSQPSRSLTLCNQGLVTLREINQQIPWIKLSMRKN